MICLQGHSDKMVTIIYWHYTFSHEVGCDCISPFLASIFPAYEITKIMYDILLLFVNLILRPYYYYFICYSYKRKECTCLKNWLWMMQCWKAEWNSIISDKSGQISRIGVILSFSHRSERVRLSSNLMYLLKNMSLLIKIGGLYSSDHRYS